MEIHMEILRIYITIYLVVVVVAVKGNFPLISTRHFSIFFVRWRTFQYTATFHLQLTSVRPDADVN